MPLLVFSLQQCIIGIQELYIFYFFPTSQLWGAGGRNISPGPVFPSKEFHASFSGLYILSCWMIRTFDRGVFSVAFVVAFSSFVFSYSTLKNKQTKKPNFCFVLLPPLLSHISHVRLCTTPEMAAHQAPPSLRFSRQEHWSGLPFPSPMHESEKWKQSRSVVSDS